MHSHGDPCKSELNDDTRGLNKWDSRSEKITLIL
jgi:hypothetical protein